MHSYPSDVIADRHVGCDCSCWGVTTFSEQREHECDLIQEVTTPRTSSVPRSQLTPASPVTCDRIARFLCLRLSCRRVRSTHSRSTKAKTKYDKLRQRADIVIHCEIITASRVIVTLHPCSPHKLQLSSEGTGTTLTAPDVPVEKGHCGSNELEANVSVNCRLL